MKVVLFLVNGVGMNWEKQRTSGGEKKSGGEGTDWVRGGDTTGSGHVQKSCSLFDAKEGKATATRGEKKSRKRSRRGRNEKGFPQVWV